MKVLVDLIGYQNVYGGGYHERNRRFDYSHDYEEMDITPQQLKDFIDKGIDVSYESTHHLYSIQLSLRG